MADKAVFEVRMDPELYRKMTVTAEAEGLNLNNYLLKLVRTNVAYYEKVHGKIKPGEKLPVIPEKNSEKSPV